MDYSSIEVRTTLTFFSTSQLLGHGEPITQESRISALPSDPTQYYQSGGANRLNIGILGVSEWQVMISNQLRII